MANTLIQNLPQVFSWLKTGDYEGILYDLYHFLTQMKLFSKPFAYG